MNWGREQLRDNTTSSRLDKTARLNPSAALSKLALTSIAAAILVAVPGTQAQKTGDVLISASYSSQLATDTANLALPLVSVGREVGWKIQEDYRLYVPQAANGRNSSLEIYSPEINRNDYANQRNRVNYYGDELYGKKAKLQTTFTVSGKQGQLAKRRFGESKQHSVAPLYRGPLKAGYYDLNVSSFGLGKNSFQFRANSGVRVEASQFVVNARGEYNKDQLVGFIDIGKSVIGKTIKLENYDADGQKEMLLDLVDPNGQHRRLSVSEDTKWAADSIKISKYNVGTWKILARILPTTVQFSNSVGFRFQVDGEELFARLPGFETTPAPVEVGTLNVGSNVKSCGGSSGIESSFKIAGKSFNSPANLTLTPGEYTLEPASIGGATTAPVRVTVKAGETGSANLEYVSGITLQLEPTSLNLQVGQTANLTATASTEFAGKLPAEIKLKLPENLELIGKASLVGMVSKDQPLVAKLSVRALKPGNSPLIVGLPGNCPSDQVAINVTSPAKVMLEKTVDKPADKLTLAPSDNATFTVTVSNVGGSSVKGAKLTDALPAGLTGKDLAETIDLEPGAKRSFQIPVGFAQNVVKPGASRVIENTAKLEWNSQTLTAAASVKVALPLDPAKLMLEKSVDKPADKFTLAPSDAAVFTVTVTNTGGSTAKNIKLEDALPAGLVGQNLSEIFDLEAGQKKSFNIPVAFANAVVAAGSSRVIENTAALNWNAQQLKASASVKVAAPNTIVAPNPAVIKLEKSVDKPADTFTLAPSDTATFTITVSNTGGSAAKNILLEDLLPEGLVGKDIEETFDLEAGAKKTFSVPVTFAADAVEPGATRVIENIAELEWNAQSMNAGASIKLAAPAVITPAEPAKLTLEKSVDKPAGQFTLVNGEAANFTLTVTNTGGSAAKDITLEDALPAGLIGQNFSQSFDLEPGAKREFGIPVTVAQDAVKSAETLEIINTAKLNWNGQSLTSSATVKVAAPVAALPAQRRESQLIVMGKLSAPISNAQIVLSNRLPSDSSYIAGSSRLVTKPSFDVNTPTTSGTQAIQDPFVSGDRLFWVLPATTSDTYAITYRVAHKNEIVVPNDPAVLLIQPNVRSAGAARTSDASALNFDPNSSIGKLVGQGDVQLLQGDANVLGALRNAVPFGGSSLNAASGNTAIGGSAASLRVYARRVTGDPADRPELIVEAFDANNLPANDKLVTIEIGTPQGRSLEPAILDAAPEIPGFQVRMENGIARVPLAFNANQVGINEITIEARIGDVSSSTRFQANEFANANLDPSSSKPNAGSRPITAVGTVGVQANINLGTTTTFTIEGGIRAFARGTVFGDWFLTAAINQQLLYNPSSSAFTVGGNLLPPANPYERFPLLGDASTIGTDARSSDGFYVKLERGASYGLYGQMTPGFKGLLSAYSPNFNGFQGVIRDEGYGIGGFVALVPNATQRNSQRADGTGFYRIPNAPIQTNSEKITVIVYDRNNDTLKLSERVLVRNTDYTVDYTAGAIQLARPLNSSDNNGNPQFLETAFASEADVAPRELRYGAQASLGSDTNGLQITGTALGYGSGLSSPSITAPTVQNALFGIGANFRSDSLQIGLEGAYSGPLGTGGLGLAGQARFTNGGFQAQARYQELFPGYIDPNSSTATSGRAFNSSLIWKFTPAFSLEGAFAHNQNFSNGNANDNASGQLKYDFGFAAISLGANARLEYANAAMLPWSTSRGIWASAGLEVPLGPIRLAAVQRIPVTGGTYGDTTLSLDYAINPSFGIRLSDTLTYEPNNIRQQLGLGARGSFTNSELIRSLTGNTPANSETFGTTNIAAAYELDTLAGDAGRTRVGIDTTIPLGSNWSTQLGGEAVFNSVTPSTAAANLGLLYTGENLRGSARAQLAWQPSGIKQVYTLGAIAKLGELTLSPSLEYAQLPTTEVRNDGSSVNNGLKFTVAASWRAERFSVLTNNIGRYGFYAPKGDELSGEIQFGYEANERLFLRSGINYRLLTGTFTGQVTLGGTYYITDQFGLGANGSYLFQPVNNISKFSLGLEANLRLLTDLTLSAGFNLIGISDPLNLNTAPGFFIRLDWKFDERLFGGNR